jgi:arsenate reductase (thioredoxin)
MKKKVLFLCTGNSCRSQMAEGWLRTLGGDRFEAFSAGIEAHGKNPRAIAVMREAGVDISGQQSKVLAAAMLDGLDLLVTVCGHADETCPAVPVSCGKEHWPFDDPAKAGGSEEEIMAEFRRVRDRIRARIEAFISSQ